MSVSRRQFVVGGCSAAIAAMAGGRIGELVFDDQDGTHNAYAAGGNDQILITVFLRGGCDGLSLISPYADGTYRTRRGSLALPDNPSSDLQVNVNNASFFGGVTPTGFSLHPSTAGVVLDNANNPVGSYSLKELYDSGNLALVHACGLDDDTRSHFDAMDYIERGTPGNKSTSTGWIARHVKSMEYTGPIPSLSSNTSAPTSLLGDTGAIAATSASSYKIEAPWRYNQTAANSTPFDAMLTTLDQIYTGSGPTIAAGRRTIEAIRVLRSVGNYSTTSQLYPTGGGAGFSDALRNIAQIIKLGLGLRIATVDLGGWDHHENQGTNGGTFSNLATTLSRGLYAFYKDIAGYENKVTIVVMSEFGRRLGINASDGTDHGHGNMMMVLGGKVNGGKMYGRWPGLEDLDQDQDLKITTDFRTVLSEAVVRVLGNPQLGTVFPGITPELYSSATALNIFQGTDPTIDYTSSMYTASLPMVVR